MVSRPELGSDPPFGSGRESGRDRQFVSTRHVRVMSNIQIERINDL